MNLATIIILVYWTGLRMVDHPTPADLEATCIHAQAMSCEVVRGCRVTFMAYRDVTEERKEVLKYPALKQYLSNHAMHHLAIVTCGEIRTEFDVWQDSNRLVVTPKK